jgi:hypothetical protein
MDEAKLAPEEYTNKLLEIIADELYVFRKDKQEQEDQEAGRQTTWRAAGERDAMRQSLDSRRCSLKLRCGCLVPGLKRWVCWGADSDGSITGFRQVSGVLAESPASM